MSLYRKLFGAGAVALPVGLALSGPANAVLDISAATAAFSDVTTAGLAIGAAAFGMFVALKLWKWARRAV